MKLRFAAAVTLQLNEGVADSRLLVGVPLAKIGSYRHQRFGNFSITHQTLAEMIRNFDEGAYGQRIFVDVAHKPENGAAAEILKLYRDGDWLKGDLELTDYGYEAITQRRYIYLSVDYDDHWKHTESGEDKGAVLFGAGLTIRPFIKGQPGIELADHFSTSGDHSMDKFLQQLQAHLLSIKASDSLSKSLSDQFSTEAKQLSDDDGALTALLKQYQLVADLAQKQLATLSTDQQNNPINLTVATGGLTAADVTRLLAEHEQTKQLAEADQAKRLTDNQGAFQKVLDDAQGLTDATKKKLAEAADLITADMTQDQAKRLAEFQLKQGNDIEVQRQLADMGYHVAGSPRIEVGEDSSIKQLQEAVDKRLGLADMPDTKRYQSVGGKLPAENKKLADAVMAAYDRTHRVQLLHESRLLGDAGGTISDTAIPGAFERTVLREALYNLVGLQFVNYGTAEFGESLYLPYSYRKTSAAGVNNTRVYEGSSIQRAGVVQTGETAYPIPQKLSFEVSDELRYLTSARNLNWEAVSENQANATRIIGEDTDRLIFNEQVQSSDEYQAVAVAAENLAPQISGGKKVAMIGGATVTTVCRPRKIFDLQGNLIGNTVNPVVVSFDGAAIPAFDPLAVNADGVSTLAAGNYYVLDYDIGEIWIVDKDGALVDPAGKVWTISYSRATNVAYFDVDVPAGMAEEIHWNGFLKVYGLRKTLIEDTRYYTPSFGMMSGTMMSQVETAKKFEANSRVPGTELAANGNLGRVKDVPNFKTSAPGLWIGDRRALIGERSVTRLRITKPWTMGQLQDQRDANGRFTGKKEAYGDQFLILHTPKYLKAALTSIVLYSKSQRVARAAP